MRVTDRQTDRRTDKILIARPRLPFMQRGKNDRKTRRGLGCAQQRHIGISPTRSPIV